VKVPTSGSDDKRCVPGEAPDPGAIVRAATWLFRYQLRLYPGQFYATFAEEMVEVFDLAVYDAAQGGSAALLKALFKEFSELPLTLISVWLYERKKESMTSVSFDTSQDVRLARWVARGLSLVFAGFVATIVILNEDVRSDLTPPMLITVALSLSSIAAWRWERTGGLVTMALAPLLFLSILVQYAGAAGLVTPVWALLLVAAAMTLSFFIAGWLFVSVGRHADVTRRPEDRVNDTRRGARWRPWLVVSVLGVISLLLFVIPLQLPVRQEMEPVPGRYVDQAYIINALRAQSAVVGVSSTPVQQPFLSLVGQELVVNGEIVQAYVYADTASATTEASALYYDADSAAWTEVVWQQTPHFYQVANVILIYDGHTQETVAALERAFGPPFAHE
jgi:MFS family permease